MSKRATKTRSSWSEKLDQRRRSAQGGADRPDDEQAMGRREPWSCPPREVDAIMKSVPSGKLITIQEIRAIVAERHRGDDRLPADGRNFRLDRRACGRRRP